MPSSRSSTAAMANGSNGSVVATYGAGGWYWASVYDHTVPRRDNGTDSNSVPPQSGLRQKNDAAGKNTVPHVVHFVPSSAAPPPSSPCSVSHPSAPSAGTLVLVTGSTLDRP